MTFSELGLREEVLQSINDLGFEAPTPIQQSAIPHLLKSDSDLVGLAQTGTGKTAAFGLPLVNNIQDQYDLTQGLVICPTRELCLQIAKDLENYAKHDRKTAVVAVYGGTDIRRQITQIKQGATIIVATPGRLVDLIERRAVKLQDIRFVVLDEADEMLNMGFKEDIDTILDQTPDEKNVWLFSATMPKEVADIAKNYMTNPLEVSIGHKNQGNVNIEHIFYTVREKDRYAALKRLIDVNPDIFGLVFCRTRHETQHVAENLSKDGYNAEPLHGDLSQAQRDNVMKRFRERTVQLLVATDVAARGIDVDNITHVINYQLPDDIENYTHRSGRTARAGKKGESLVLINLKEHYKIKAIERQMRTDFTKGTIPSANEICGIQLSSLIHKVKETEVKEKDIEEFLPTIMSDFEHLSKEEVIKKFISVEFNRFVEYYSKAQDLNVSESKDRRDRGDRPERGDRDRERGGDRRERFDREDKNRTRFFVSLGKRDGLNPGGLLRLICDEAGLNSSSVGKIDVMPSFSFFEADNDHTDTILKAVNGANYEGNKVSVEITKKKAERRSGGGDRDRDFRGSRDRGDRGGDRGSERRSGSGSGFGDRKREGGGFGSRNSGGDRDRSSSRPRSRNNSYGRNS
jgi:ATP-dependent RNA helicase DeaD